MACFCAAAEVDGAAGELGERAAADKEREADGSVRPELHVLSVSRQTGSGAAAASAPTDQPQPGHRPLQRE